jgi:hypothetical protein
MSVISGIVGAVEAGNAADTQAESADKATKAMLEMFYKSRDDTAPWRKAGEYGLNKLIGTPATSAQTVQGAPIYGTSTSSGGGTTSGTDTGHWAIEMNYDMTGGQIGTLVPKAVWVGPGESSPNALTGGGGGSQIIGYQPSTTIPATTGTPGLLEKGPGDFRETPGYKFRLEEGVNALDKSAAAKGRLMSGAHEKSLIKFGQDYATSEYDKNLQRYYESLNPYFSLAGLGQVSANNSSNAAIATGSNISDNALYAGNARASGYINQANALTGASRSIVNALPYFTNNSGAYNWGSTIAGSAAGADSMVWL